MSDLLRLDQLQIVNLIPSGSSVLDLGCGNGEFLFYLQRYKNIRGVGIELSQDKVLKCLEKGLDVVHADLDSGLALFERASFDYVILNETLQVLREPIVLLKEMLRVGRFCIIGINNFGYWKVRLDLLLRGRMPVTRALPYEWHNTPNIHLCTLEDFEVACLKNEIKVLERIFMDKPPEIMTAEQAEDGKRILKGFLRWRFNLFSCFGVYLIKDGHE